MSFANIYNTANGDVANFDDGADEMFIKSLVANIESQQDLHGYDSPWPAGGGNNKFHAEIVNGNIGSSTGENTTSASAYRCRTNDYIAIKPSTVYTLSYSLSFFLLLRI